MESREQCPECWGIGKISTQNCVKCGSGSEVIIHSHPHGHGKTSHDHPHPHPEPHSPAEFGVSHDHAHTED